MCEHERLRTVNNRVFCCACGEELTLEFLASKSAPKDEPKEEKPKRKTAKKPVKGGTE